MRVKKYIKRKIGSVLISAILLCMLSVSVYAADTLPINAASTSLRSSGNESDSQALLRIDHDHVYEGMEQAYKYGYTPTITDGEAIVILPLLADGDVKENKITASVDLGKANESPFVYKNYRKSFSMEEKQIDGMKETQSLYYVRFDLALSQDRFNGNYPVVVEISGKNEQGKSFSQSFTIYVTISDGAADHEGIDSQTDQNVNAGIYTDASDGKADADSKDGSTDDLPQAGGASDSADESYGSADSGDASSYGGGDASGGAGESSPTSEPIVLVSGSSLAPATVTAGEAFSAVVFLKNTSKKKNVQNMVVTVSYDTTMFTSKDDSDTVYIASLKKGEVMELPLTFQVMNLGRSKIYNVRCEISGYGLLPTNTGFVGDMEPGTEGEAGINLFIGTKDQTEGYTGTDPYGDTDGLITLYYEDADGQAYTAEYTFSTCIEKAVVSGGTSSEEDERAAGQWWISALVAAGIIAAVLGWMISRKRKRV